MRRSRVAVAAILCVLVAGLACAGQSEGTGPAVEERLAGFAAKMQVGLSIASVAVFSPTLRDARGQAGRLLEILRGGGTEPTPGLMAQADAFADWILARPFQPDARDALLRAAADVQQFLRLAAESAAAVGRARNLSDATDSLWSAYAFLLAAWGQPVEGIVVPGFVLLLHAFDIPLGNEA